MSRPFQMPENPKKEPKDMFLLIRRNLKIILSINSTPSVMGKLSIIMKTEAAPNFLRGSPLALFL